MTIATLRAALTAFEYLSQAEPFPVFRRFSAKEVDAILAALSPVLEAHEARETERPRVAHSKSEYKRLTAMGANVRPPADPAPRVETPDDDYENAIRFYDRPGGPPGNGLVPVCRSCRAIKYHPHLTGCPIGLKEAQPIQIPPPIDWQARALQAEQERDEAIARALTSERFRSEDAADHLDDQAMHVRRWQKAEAALKELNQTAAPAEIALVLAHAEGLKANPWQPIETANAKHGQVILAYVPDEDDGNGDHWSRQIALFNDDYQGLPSQPFWHYQGETEAYSRTHQPTHWMPIPSPPDSQPARDDLIIALERVCRGADHWYAQREEQGQ